MKKFLNAVLLVALTGCGGVLNGGRMNTTRMVELGPDGKEVMAIDVQDGPNGRHTTVTSNPQILREQCYSKTEPLRTVANNAANVCGGGTPMLVQAHLHQSVITQCDFAVNPVGFGLSLAAPFGYGGAAGGGVVVPVGDDFNSPFSAGGIGYAATPFDAACQRFQATIAGINPQTVTREQLAVIARQVAVQGCEIDLIVGRSTSPVCAGYYQSQGTNTAPAESKPHKAAPAKKRGGK